MNTFSTVTKLLFGRKGKGDTKNDTKERIVDGVILSGNEETKPALPTLPITSFQIENQDNILFYT